MTFSTAQLRSDSSPRASIALAVAALTFGAVMGPVAVVSIWYACALLILVVAFTVAFLRPHYATYAFLFLAPLVIGIKRGSFIPVLRPSEVLIVVFGAALVTRRIAMTARGQRMTLNPTRFDVALVTLALLGSVLPLAWMAARGMWPSTDDFLHALVFWKYIGLYLIVKTSIKTHEQVRRCLWIVLSANTVVASIGIVQALRLFGVDQLMATYFPPVTVPTAALIGRGTSTLGGSIAMGDVMAFSAAIAVTLAINGDERRGRALGLAGLFLLGATASGQFSGVIALIVALLVVGILTRQFSRLFIAVVVGLSTTSLILAPVVSQRLAGFSSSAGGLPPSWTGRLTNLQTRVWPRVFSDFSYVFGVRPSPRIPAWESWRVWIYIESGHTWLLWVGGIPLLAAFFYFNWVALQATARVARARTDAVGGAAVAACAGVVVVFVLTALDWHLTLRGTADLLFPLLALSLLAIPESAASETANGRIRGGGEGHASRT